MTDAYLRQSALDHLALAGRATAMPGGDAGPSAVQLGERLLPAAVNLRGDKQNPAFLDAVKQALKLDLPTTPNSTASNGVLTLLWLGPDEWLATFHDATPEADGQLVARLREALKGQHAAVTAVGESLACIAISGPRARDVIAKGCPLDLHPRVFGGPGHCAQSHLAKTAIILHQTAATAEAGPSFDLYTRRSFADYLWRWLEDAAQEYGVAVVLP